jgi:hypothetical protein
MHGCMVATKEPIADKEFIPLPGSAVAMFNRLKSVDAGR